MKLSFGMIFSIILIIFFVAFAFFAINKFVGIQKSIEVGQFSDELESVVNKMWQGSQGSQALELRLPKKIQLVCFGDYRIEAEARGQNEDLFDDLTIAFYENENLIFYPIGSGEGLDAINVEHLDIEKMTERDNPLCFKNEDGKVKMVVKKEFEEALVTISR